MNSFSVTQFHGQLPLNPVNKATTSYESSQYSQSEQNQDGSKSKAALEIYHPGVNDVLQGRGSAANNHIGNIRFREMVKKYEERYMLACKSDKPLVALEIVLVWKRQNPPGRFLAYDNGKGRDNDDETDKRDCWYEISEQVATRKVAQRLREKNTSFNMSQLRRRQKQAINESLLTKRVDSHCSTSTNGTWDSINSTNNTMNEVMTLEAPNALPEVVSPFACSPINDDNNFCKIGSIKNFNSKNRTKTFGALKSMMLPLVSKFEEEDNLFGMLELEEQDVQTNGFIAMSIPNAAELLDVFE